MSRRTIKLTLAYDGSAYSGWQRQAEALTVQGEVEKALHRLTGEVIGLIGAGRTDAGVHALGQVAGFRTESKLAGAEMKRALNALTPDDVQALDVREVEPDFHARYDASGKCYQYHLWIGREEPLFFRPWVWHLGRELDREAVRDCLARLVGHHDFAAFQSTGSQVATTVRRMTRAELETDGPLWTFTLEADGFLRHMVRAVVGTVVDYPDPERVAAILASADRSLAGRTAPAKGLFMVRVHYPGHGQPVRAAGPFEALHGRTME